MWKHRRPSACAGYIALALALVTVDAAEAQFESYLKDITDIGFFSSCWDTRGAIERTSGCIEGLEGFGVEVMYRLAPVPLKFMGGDRRMVRDSTLTALHRSRSDSVAIFTMSQKPVMQGPYVLFELALGYSQFSGFRSQEPGVELRGTVRELPALSLYATMQNDDAETWIYRIQPYLGVRTGLIQLHNVQLYDAEQPAPAAVHTASAQAFQIGVIGGLALRLGPHVSPFVEVARTQRAFPSVQWTMVNNQVHPAAPRILDYSGWSRSIGVQFRLR